MDHLEILNKLSDDVIGAEMDIEKRINATPPEGLWLFPDRHLPCGMRSLFLWGLAIGEKGKQPLCPLCLCGEKVRYERRAGFNVANFDIRFGDKSKAK